MIYKNEQIDIRVEGHFFCAILSIQLYFKRAQGQTKMCQLKTMLIFFINI